MIVISSDGSSLISLVKLFLVPKLALMLFIRKALLTLEDFAKTAVAQQRRPGRTVIEAKVAIEDAP